MNSGTFSSEPVARSSQLSFVFFGAGPIAVAALNAMQEEDAVPKLIVTAPDRPAGRGHTVTPSPVAQWATTHDIETLKPEKLDAEFISALEARNLDLEAVAFVVIDYGKFLPKKLIEMPTHGTLNMHPSLLPRLRGPSPIRSAILNDEKNTGVTVMLLDEEMDHGPILAQRKVYIPGWSDPSNALEQIGFARRSLGEGGPPRGRELDEILAREGGKLVSEILPLWIRGDIEPRQQNHDVATFTQMFSKEDGELDLNADGYQNLLKIRAFDGWPGTYAFFEKSGKRIRVQILDAHLIQQNDPGGRKAKLIIDKVKPEGKGETDYAEFTRSGAVPLPHDSA